MTEAVRNIMGGGGGKREAAGSAARVKREQAVFRGSSAHHEVDIRHGARDVGFSCRR